MKPSAIFCFCAACALCALGSCDIVEPYLTFDSTPSRTIVIVDDPSIPYDPDDPNTKSDMWLASIKEDQFVLLALFPASFMKDFSRNWASQLTLDDLINMAFTVRKIENGKFESKLMRKDLEFWTGSGSYWVAFIMVDGKMSLANLGYLSKSTIYFPEKQSYQYFTNLDFMGNVEMAIDLRDMPGKPFD